ncbi:MAG: hypothetical protein QOE06_3458 [Thermoleophilaceae bacterium]|jgi:hypothetical protein|nr:hypothetical protein [Thermoleophilaceae bacterium]
MAVAGGLRVIQVARRVAPIAAEVYRRWSNLSPAEKERYKKRARQYGERGRDAGIRLFALVQEQAKQANKRRPGGR